MKRFLVFAILVASLAVPGHAQLEAHARRYVASITLASPATFTQPNDSETDLLAAASEIHIYRASKTVVIVYAIGNAGTNGEVQAGRFSHTYTLNVNWSDGSWADSLSANGLLTSPQLTTMRSDLNTLCNHSESLAISLGKLSGTQNPC